MNTDKIINQDIDDKIDDHRSKKLKHQRDQKINIEIIDKNKGKYRQIGQRISTTTTTEETDDQ